MKTKIAVILVLLLLGVATVAQNNNQEFAQGLNKNMSQNFNMDLARSHGFENGELDFLVYILIDSYGDFNVNVRAPHKNLAIEAVRIVNEYYAKNKEKIKRNGAEIKFTVPVQFMVEGK